MPGSKELLAPDLIDWAARNGLLSENFSGEHKIPQQGDEKVLLELEVPEGQTWYSTTARYAVEGSRPARYRAWRVSPTGERTQVAHAVVPANDMRDRDTRGKWPAGAKVQITLKPDKDAKAGDLASVSIRFAKLGGVE